MDAFKFTKTTRRTSYRTISPSERPELSCHGKTVYITGAGDGSIGSGIALSFAKAGAAKIGLFGRTATTLNATKARIEKQFPNVEAQVVIMDQADNRSTGLAAHNARVQIGAWDIFVNGATHLPALTTIAGSDDEDWFRTFEVSIKFIQYWSTHFRPKSRPNATYISLSASAAAAPANALAFNSAYTTMKVASMKMDEFIAFENPTMRVFTVDPGIVETRMFRTFKKTFTAMTEAPDDMSLCSDFCVWLASQEAEFLRGRFVSANFDVDELLTRKDEFEKNHMLLRLHIGGLNQPPPGVQLQKVAE
jgi:NAD(P)-dependent dehydrogenase (short-subunit alcohol dehydrogenase family)